MSIVGGGGLQTTRMHSFVSVWVAHARIKVAWTRDWSRFSLLFDIHGEYRGKCLDESWMKKGERCECGVVGDDKTFLYSL